MDDFQALVSIIERLLAPDGCPWDREQTLSSMRGSLIEETYEVVEAIDLNNQEKIEEELGDLLFNVVFLSKLAERDHDFTLAAVLRRIAEKLIRRHPHIFGEAQVKDSEEVLKQWEAIKQSEKKEKPFQSVLDNVPKDLPSLARAQKMIKKFDKAGFDWSKQVSVSSPEDAFAKELIDLINRGSHNGLEAETALRKQLSQLDQAFRSWELAKHE